jgi:hypothetical protein
MKKEISTKNIKAEDIKRLRKLQSDLVRINNGEKFFFNCTAYENMGIIRSINKTVATSNGNTESQYDRHILTEKGKMIINTML